VVTTLLMVLLMRERWGWGRLRVAAFAAVFLAIDLAFWVANIIKVPHGGWFPLVAGAAVFTLITTWKAGRQLLGRRMAESTLPWDFFVKDMSLHPPHRVPGTAVFMYGNRNGTPPALLHSLKHYGVLHERVVLLAVETDEIPHVPPEARTTTEALGHGFFRIVLHYGFMDEPDVPAALAGVRVGGLDLSPLRTTYFLGRETLIPSRREGLAPWRERLFAVMSRNARTATSFFALPPNRVVELGAQIEL
jgi:KUP system potassium uptake protein